jgi:hypothetical protein
MLFSYTVNGGFYVTVFITVLSLFTVVDFLRNVLVVHAHEVRDKVRARRTAARAGSRVDGVHPTRISSFARPAAVAGCRCFAAVPVDRHRRVRCSAARVSRLGCVARSHHMHMLLCWLIACHWQWGGHAASISTVQPRLVASTVGLLLSYTVTQVWHAAVLGGVGMFGPLLTCARVRTAAARCGNVPDALLWVCAAPDCAFATHSVARARGHAGGS